MDFKDCVKFANEAGICYLANVENGKPHVRALGMWYADATGFYLQTTTMKDMYKQLKADPKVELCFFKSGDNAGGMLRAEGEIEFLHDRDMKKKCLDDRPFLKGFGLTPDSPELVIFRLAKGRAHFWTMPANFKPKEYIYFG